MVGEARDGGVGGGGGGGVGLKLTLSERRGLLLGTAEEESFFRPENQVVAW